jgi:hypothetical protein
MSRKKVESLSLCWLEYLENRLWKCEINEDGDKKGNNVEEQASIVKESKILRGLK